MKFVLLFIFSICSLSLCAQISGSSSPKDISGKRVQRKDKAEIMTKISVGGNYQTGNTEKSGIIGTASIASVDSVKELSANGGFAYGENKSCVNQREYKLGGQYDYHPLSAFSPFLRFEFYSNEFRKINYRCSGLTGAKFRIYRKEDHCDYSLSAALLYDLENYTEDANQPNKERLRVSIRPKIRQKIMENIFLSAEMYYKPNLAEFSDYMIYSIFNLNFKVNRYIFLKASYEYEYNNRPVTASVKKTDTLLLGSLGAEF